MVPPTAGGFPSATVFLLHGLGDTAQGWLDVARMLGRNQALQHVRFVLPTAPTQPVTVNMGMSMTSWFDLYSLTDLEQGEDEAGMLRSVSSVMKLVEQETDGSAPGLNGHGVPMRVALCWPDSVRVALSRNSLDLRRRKALRVWRPSQRGCRCTRKSLPCARASKPTPFSKLTVRRTPWSTTNLVAAHSRRSKPILDSATQLNGTSTRCHTRLALPKSQIWLRG